MLIVRPSLQARTRKPTTGVHVPSAVVTACSSVRVSSSSAANCAVPSASSAVKGMMSAATWFSSSVTCAAGKPSQRASVTPTSSAARPAAGSVRAGG